MTGTTILWKRLDAPGHESCRCIATDSGWRLEGAAVFAHEGQPCRLAEDMYRYESLQSGFTADLQANAAGFVTLYPRFLDVEPGS